MRDRQKPKLWCRICARTIRLHPVFCCLLPLLKVSEEAGRHAACFQHKEQSSMKLSTAFFRVLFALLSLVFTTAYMISLPSGSPWSNGLLGILLGSLISALLFGLERLCKNYSLRAFNTATLGLLFGFLFGKALVHIASALFAIAHFDQFIQPQTLDLLCQILLLTGTYLGCLLTLHFSEEITISIPFVRLNTSGPKKKDLLVDLSALSDTRLIDLASTGLLDHQLVIPRCLLKSLCSSCESPDEAIRNQAKAALDTVRRLEELTELGLRFDETRSSSDSDLTQQVFRIARLSDSNVLSAETSEIDLAAPEGIRIINLHNLSNALKPLMQAGRFLKIKIQRFGKEPNQGVGYLEDGTMVVVNGGGDYIGDIIDVQVLSVKHTSSGRMIFCNTLDSASLKGNRLEV